MLKKRSKIASQTFKSFEVRGWPNAIVITGQQSAKKKSFVREAIQKALLDNQVRGEPSLSGTRELLSKGEHPDCYVFNDVDTPIGQDRSLAPKGSVRHLLQHFIPYAPHQSKLRFILFENATKIRDQAESALLKVLEEPPPQTHFILCSQTAHDLKETIRSRCLTIPFVDGLNEKEVPADPWARFWFFSGQLDSTQYQFICQTNWHDKIKELYDYFSYTNKDFLILDSLGPINVKRNFPKASLEEQTRIIILNLLPLYFSLRDNLFEGKTPTIGPIRIPQMEIVYCYALLVQMRNLFSVLRKKYFGTRAVNPLPAYYQFLNRFSSLWIFKS